MKKKLSLILLLLITITIAGVLSTKEVKAENNEKYSIEYLLRNYNVVTFGQKDSNLTTLFGPGPFEDEKGSIVNLGIEGAVLVAGNYTSENDVTFGENAESVKSFIKGTKGDNVTTTSQLATDPSFVDFEKMYVQVVNEQQILLDKTTKDILGPEIEITSPGIYTIHNSALYESEDNAQGNTSYGGNNRLFIKNYDKNALYVFNVYDELATASYNMVITQSSSPTAMNFDELVNSGDYTGNIIWNFPKAKYVVADSYQGSIIAPKADAFYGYGNYNNKKGLLVNSIFTYTDNYIGKIAYSSTSKIIDEEVNSYIDDNKDYNDDFYSGSYSLSELLQNYSLISLGKKNLESKTQLAQKGQSAGTIRLFHAAGPVLINGDLYSEARYEGNNDYQTCNTTRLDLESNTVNESYIKGQTFIQLNNRYGNSYTGSRALIQPWDNVTNSRRFYNGRNNKLFVGTANGTNYNMTYNFYNTPPTDNYINFDRLYDKVISQQKEIEEGSKTSISEGVAHIKVGGNYVIEDINNLNEIVFDNFDENKDKITIITVKNSGDINFPLISKDTGPYKGIVTNDYYNKTEVTHPYEISNLVKDSYHGNIIWNVPNATYIKLKENAPFAGHLIAPKADVETPELHFSGCFIVNSLYAEGNTEAHFYPLTSFSTYETPEYNDLSVTMKKMINSRRLGNILGEKAIEEDKEVVGDQEQYREIENRVNEILAREAKPTNNIVEILTNPKTYRNIGFILVLGGLMTYTIINKKKQKTEK